MSMYIINSVPKSATRWTTRALTECVENCRAVHEAVIRKSVDFYRWGDRSNERSRELIAVGPAGYAVDEILKVYPDAKWSCIWRNPLDHFISLSHLRGFRPSLEWAAYMALQWWGEREFFLRVAEERGLEVSHWHLDYITTREGFEEMVKSMGLTVKPGYELPEIVGATAVKLANEGRGVPHDWNDFDRPADECKQRIMWAFNNMPYTKATYERAIRSLEEVPA